MFCDLVGSTELSGQLDPEELREIVRAYQAACAEVIARFDGYIAQYLGDGLLVYFGFPKAHDDDARRAVYAGLGIVHAVERLALGNARRVAVRIGVHTGLVVVGGVGTGDRQERLALGETPNIAARLQALAAPDSVVISAATYRLVQGFFVARDLGSQHLKGVPADVRAYQAVDESGAQTPLDVAAAAGLTPLIGREQEVALLLERWDRVLDSQGQIVLLSGEPGIGKSRLVRALTDRVAAMPHVRLEGRCSPYYEHTPLYPVIDLLPRFLGWSREDSPDTKLEKLESRLARYALPLKETVPTLASLLALPCPTQYPPIALTPQQIKQQTLETIVAFVLAMAAREPVLLVLEDLHWVDPSTIDLLNLLVDQTPTAHILMLLTARPSFRSPWPVRGHTTLLTLSRLVPRQTEQMVRHAAKGKILPSEVVEQIGTKTDGVPLFVEELTKMVLESGLLRESGDRYELSGPLPTLAIPSTLQDSLAARLDRLATVKDVAQLAATLGRTFRYELLRSVITSDEAALRRGLGRLVDAELLYQRGVLPDATYVFKHVLVQETAYQSILKSTRAQYHERIAQTLVEQFPEEAETRPEFIAHHYTEAGLNVEAIGYWQRAGHRALERSANLEAIEHFGKGLELLSTLPKSRSQSEQELTLQLGLGPAYEAIKGYGAPEAFGARSRARELCLELGRHDTLASLLGGLFVVHLVRAELSEARRYAEELLNLGNSQGAIDLVSEGHTILGGIMFWFGEFSVARRHLEESLRVYDVPGNPPPAGRRHPKVNALGYLSYCLQALGYPDRSIGALQDAIQHAKLVSNAHGLAYALGLGAYLGFLIRDPGMSLQWAEATIAFAHEHRFALWEATGQFFRGWVLAENGRHSEGVADMLAGLAGREATGCSIAHPLYRGILGRALCRSGEVDQGLRLLDEGLAAAQRTFEHAWEAELLRLKGEALQQHATVDAGEAESWFERAIRLARQQEAKSFELRAGLSLARSWAQRGKREEARELLSPIYYWFTEGFDTADLRDAKALLEELT
jgi:class 3 adenylate cyclase/tetratricopeptide (TPR) repeat protein